MPKHSRATVGSEGLRHPEDRRSLNLGAYYTVLNEDADFRGELAALTGDILVNQAARFYRRSGECCAASQPALGGCLPQPVVASVFGDPDPSAAIAAFVRRWHLPACDGLVDVEASLMMPAVDGEVRLRVGPRGASPGHARQLLPPVLIRPPELPSFLYVPWSAPQGWGAAVRLVGGLESARRMADRMAKQLRESVLRQVREADESTQLAGWTPTPPRYRSGISDVLAVARRLHRFVNLGLSWKEIAEMDDVRSDVARASVYSLAKMLRVSLRNRRRGSRHR